MLTIPHLPHAWSAVAQATVNRFQLAAAARIAALRSSRQHRQEMALLAELRDHYPQLFEETRVDPAALPPPAVSSVSLFPHVVISGLFEGEIR